ncbi:ATP-dependent helicase [Solidesulfovibrio alcoholivorans]|uniref:ATP-dependent helicase n=1 Tax=Solidesulfovibrio alcoholivorans TaxID=81406 RepID=UPI0004958B5A|nr:ATP-dependent helicase [Solidesulfovibrio alcoholivorans]
MDFDRDLNPAQRQAVMTTEGPVLVIAGAGSGKTRTIVYRLAHLVSGGVDPASILLLTFTRKAAQEMLTRAGMLLAMGPDGVSGVSGGTFHAFAFATLRRFHAAAGYPDGFTVLDAADCEDILGQVKDSLGVGKGDRSFPRKSAVLGMLSKARNKELDVGDVISREAFHLLPHASDIARLGEGYTAFKAEHNLLDYDDLLFSLERMLTEHADLADYLRERHRYVMVDEYQDTNRVQARLTRLLAPGTGNVMAVGDDAQSIYAFRGATVDNILDFPNLFPGTLVVKLEQNYRSTQPILTLTNAILKNAGRKFEKNLFSTREDGPEPELIRPFSDLTQAAMVTARIRELSGRYPLHEIAVLFRAGYQSYALEVELGKAGIPFQKFGGLRFSDAAHVKDVLSYLRLARNTADFPAWNRVLAFVPGIGAKTAAKIFAAIQEGDRAVLGKMTKKSEEFRALIEFLDVLRSSPPSPADLLERVIEAYAPLLAEKFPDDYPRRQAGLEQLQQIAASYADLDAFLADLVIENPDEDRKKTREDHVVLSTVHSAKGLEWAAVLVIDLVDERFPSRHALSRTEDMEEERRLLYVACTRARDALSLFAPETVYQRQGGGCAPALPSIFLRELPAGQLIERRERLGGRATSSLAACTASGLAASGAPRPAPCPPRPVATQPETAPTASARSVAPGALGYCRHKIFGRGKIIAALDDGKVRVNFPDFGPKVILAAYLEMEDASQAS